MPEIAYTALGRNALLAGLVSHLAAIVVAMMTASGANRFFSIVFPFACLALALAAYVELKNRGGAPLTDWRFYVMAAVTVFPLLGPLIVLGLLYRIPKDGEQRDIAMSGLLPAMLRLRANVLVIFALVLILFLLFAVISSKNDPYFKRRIPNSQSQQSALNRGQYEPAMRIFMVVKGEASC